MKYGQPPYLDVSLGGNHLFCASFAELNGNPIRYHILGTAKERDLNAHKKLWRRYLRKHPILQSRLMRATGVEDCLETNKEVSHVRALWEIRQELLDDSL